MQLNRARRTKAVLLVAVALILFPLRSTSQELSPDTLRLARAMNTNRDLLKPLKLYTCLETMERFRPGAKGRYRAGDVVQLDVGVSERREIYSWPGDAGFSPLDLGQLVGHGLLATGLFSGFAKDLFVSGSGVVRMAGEEILQGHNALKFTYQIPSLSSRWQIHWHGKDGQLGEAGQFWVNAEDFHLLRLSVIAQDIPPQMLLQSLELIVDYQLVDDERASTLVPPRLVPISASLHVVEMNGKTLHNAVAFSHCHVFETESKISTSEDSMAATLTNYKKQLLTMPPGLTLNVELSEPISARDAVVGQLVNARLRSAVKVPPYLIIPTGSVLKGRIRQFERVEGDSNSYLVGLEFSDLEWNDRSYRFLAEMVSLQPLPGISMKVSTSPRGSTYAGGTKRTIEGGSGSMEAESQIGLAIPGAATFFLTNRQIIPAGFQMIWRTLRTDE